MLCSINVDWQFRQLFQFKNGVIQGSLLALDYMGKHKGGKGGTIVNIASTMALKIMTEIPIYCTTKHAVLAFSRCIQVTIMHTEWVGARKKHDKSWFSILK